MEFAEFRKLSDERLKLAQDMEDGLVVDTATLEKLETKLRSDKKLFHSYLVNASLFSEVLLNHTSKNNPELFCHTSKERIDKDSRICYYYFITKNRKTDEKKVYHLGNVSYLGAKVLLYPLCYTQQELPEGWKELLKDFPEFRKKLWNIAYRQLYAKSNDKYASDEYNNKFCNY